MSERSRLVSNRPSERRTSVSLSSSSRTRSPVRARTSSALAANSRRTCFCWSPIWVRYASASCQRRCAAIVSCWVVGRPACQSSSCGSSATSSCAASLSAGDEVAGRVAGGLDEPGQDVGQVVELHHLAHRVDRLLLVVPLAVGGVLVGEPGGPHLVDRVEDEVVLLVVDQLDRADLAQPLAVCLEEAAQLLGRLVDEVAPLELGLAGQLAEGGDAGRAHGLKTRSGPIRSRRKMMCFLSKIDSATRWPRPRAAGSA